MANILTWMISVIETTPERWMHLAQKLPDELLRRPAKTGEWSALECLHHLVATENVFVARVEAFLSGQPSFPAYNPDAPENKPDLGMSPTELASEFARRRSATLKTLQDLAEADLQRTSRHAQLGPVTLGQMIHEWAAHDLNHTMQAERAMMQPFLAGCGPWIEYFGEHVME